MWQQRTRLSIHVQFKWLLIENLDLDNWLTVTVKGVPFSKITHPLREYVNDGRAALFHTPFPVAEIANFKCFSTDIPFTPYRKIVEIRLW